MVIRHKVSKSKNTSLALITFQQAECLVSMMILISKNSLFGFLYLYKKTGVNGKVTDTQRLQLLSKELTLSYCFLSFKIYFVCLVEMYYFNAIITVFL